jgi:hypothetical protein
VSIFKDSMLVKTEIIFPYNIEKVICGTIPLYEIIEYDKFVTSYQELNYYTKEDLKNKGYKSFQYRPCVHINFDIDVPILLRKRKFPHVSSVDYNKKEGVFQLIEKACPHPDYIDKETNIFKWEKKKIKNDKNEKTLYFMNDFCLYQIKKLDENRTIYSQVHIVDFKGWTHQKIFHKSSLKKRTEMFKKVVFQHLDQKPDDFSFKTMQEKLKLDPYGKLIYDAIKDDLDDDTKLNDKNDLQIDHQIMENEKIIEKIESKDGIENENIIEKE